MRKPKSHKYAGTMTAYSILHSGAKNSAATSNVIEGVEGKSLGKKITSLNKVPHPKGRKTAQLTKKALRTTAKEKGKLIQQMKVNLLGEKLLWFKDNLHSVDSYTPQLTISLIEKYLGRFDDELQQIQLKHSVGKRKGRQHANREDIINLTIKNERNEFLTCGIEVPDVLNSRQLDLLKNWSGELRFLQNFKIVRYTKNKLLTMMTSQQKPGEEERATQQVTDEEDAAELMELDS